MAFAGLPGASQSFSMVVDTGSPFTILAAPPGASAQTNPASWNLYGAAFSSSSPMSPAPLRATFSGWDVIGVPLYPAGDPTFLPQGVLGADLLRRYSVEFRFGAPCPAGGSALCSSMTFWNHLGEDASLLEDAGYAVVNFTAFGGGEITAEGDPDFLGLRGPLDVPPTRVVLRACALPDAFSPVTGSAKLSPALLASCSNGQDALNQASGVDLSLMIDTGVGPLVLSASAWTRVVAAAVKAGLTPPLPSRSTNACRAVAPTALRCDLVQTDRRPALGDHPPLRSHQPRGGVRQRSWTLRRARAVAAHGDRRVPEPDGHPTRNPSRGSAALRVTSIPTTRARRRTARPIWRSAVRSRSRSSPTTTSSCRGCASMSCRRGPSSMAWSAPTRSAARGWSSTISRRRRALSSPARRTPRARSAGRRPAARSCRTARRCTTASALGRTGCRPAVPRTPAFRRTAERPEARTAPSTLGQRPTPRRTTDAGTAIP